MKLVLHTKAEGKQIVVDADSIKLIEPAQDEGGGSHIVFGADFGRVVKESPVAIASAIGVVAVKDMPESASLLSIAKKKR